MANRINNITDFLLSVIIVGLLFFSTLNLNGQSKPIFKERAVFTAKLDGVNVFRIPSLITLPNGTVLAFCEARDGGDKSPTDLVLRRSKDNGDSWGVLETVLRGQGGAIMNPTPVYDKHNGVLLLLINYVIKSTGYDRLLLIKSIDEGLTWTAPVDLTHQLGSVHVGPGVGIQLNSARLIIPGRASDEETEALVVYSDDYGKSWKKGGLAKTQTNESQAIELDNGKLMLNMRNTNGSGLRAVAISDDGGITWSEIYEDETLIDPVCQGSIIRFTLKDSEFKKNRMLFANPAQQRRGKRSNMTVRLSYDEGKTWPVSKVINKGPSAYSCLSIMKDGTIGLLYEGGENSPYETIRFAKFNLEWLTNCKDSLMKD